MQVFNIQRILSFSLTLTRKLNETQQTRVKCPITRGLYLVFSNLLQDSDSGFQSVLVGTSAPYSNYSSRRN